MTHKAYIFECSSSTYMDCMEKNLFGSNKPWPLEIKAGDYCLLHHYEIGGLLGLWRATASGAKNIVPKIWGGKFPYQVRIQLAIPKAEEVPKSLLADLGADPSVGRFDPLLEAVAATTILDYFAGYSPTIISPRPVSGRGVGGEGDTARNTPL
jgi:hypothetical protein